MTIDEIYNKGDITIRAYNSCKSAGIEFVSDLVQYFQQNGSFKKFRNCGNKTNSELIHLCQKYQSVDLTDKSTSLEYKIKNLSKIQRQIVNSYVKFNTENLSVRSKNAIIGMIGEPLRIKDFSQIIFEDKNFKIQHIRNIGKNSIPELEAYLIKIKDFTLKVSNNKNEDELIILKNKHLIQNTFSIETIPIPILQSKSIIIICNFLINQRVFFKEKHNLIFQETINVFIRDKDQSLDAIANKFYYTRERVRQIREKCYDELFERLSFLKHIEDDFNRNYQIDINRDYLIISNERANNINSRYGTHFTKNFLTYLFSVYLSDSYNIIGNIKDTLINKQFLSRNRHNWKNIYLVKKEFDQLIDLESLIEDISFRTQEKIEETYSFNFKSYLSRFLKTNNLIISDIIVTFCEKLLIEELDIYLDLDDNIIFNRTTIKGLPEYIIEVLDELGKPTTIEHIYSILDQAYPGLTKSSEALRGSCQRTTELIYFGRSSTYGLRKWEKENTNIKGGTIRSIVKDYLDTADTPKHSSLIVEYVLQYRPKSNEYSIIQNLKLDESGTFKFFKKSYIGLSYKRYDSSYSVANKCEIPERKTWEESFKLLTEFVSQHSRLPYSSGCPKSEEVLYRWYHIQIRNNNNGKLEIEKSNKIQAINNQFSKSKRKSNSKEKYSELNTFIKTNKRLPSANKQGEENLYQFFYKQRKLFNNNTINIEDEKRFIEIAKELQ
ncbi:DNA-directed RNA polymerase subunit alpha C-terminal domain-containing protein [Ancylomarina longa]|uniref:RNA polymerase alpha subunit C-terminal domain-containing protein n=1 Tax=Ancylomarina longa TaxID=2487017 RepID=A0A434AUK4_9BACT|nr:DNA-directed RNA polymerase subunit alpha C-terminal domain-containing protein [Ancylomarina longa]RUT78024.1 hypothetical protein DLK05_10270 [Ancylomarina longa]